MPGSAGRIFDVTSSYAAAFEFFIVIDAIGPLASYACLPLAAEQVRLTTGTGRIRPQLTFTRIVREVLE